MAKDLNICVGFSSVCFEYWILLHYVRTTKPFSDCDELIDYIRDKYDPSYLKKNNHYNDLKSLINTAIENGKWLVGQMKTANPNKRIYEINPYTNVYELVEFILDISLNS